MQKIAEHYSSRDSLASIRFLFVLLVGYAGFFRIDELQNMMLKDVNIFSDHMSVFTPKRKNDQFREGHTSFLAKSGKATCPVAITEKLVKLLPTSNYPRVPLVRHIIKSGSKECFHSCKAVSY